MEISLILILLPGLVAFGISKVLCGLKDQPLNEIIIDLVLQTVFVFTIYYLFSANSWIDLPKIGDLIYASLKIKSEPDVEKIRPLLSLFVTALFASIVIAFFAGIISAVFFKELKVVQRLGRYLWLFQSDASESAWKKTFSSGSMDCWVHIDTKGGKRYVGLSHSISWEHKDGGIGLSDVRIYDEHELEVVADYIYVPFDELDGPVLFVKGNQRPAEGET